MGNKSIYYDFNTAYGRITPEILGSLRLLDVYALIAMTKMHMVENPHEMLIFFEALKNAMETYYPKNIKTIDFFGRFDYNAEIANPSLDLNGKSYPFKIVFFFLSIKGYGIQTMLYFDFDGNFCALGNSERMGWTEK